MEKAIMIKRAQTHKKKGSIVQKAILPSVCFAALSTIAFEKGVFAAQNKQVQMAVDGTQKYVNISSGTLNLRSSPSTGASIVATLSKGTVVAVYSEKNGWSKVSANGKDGYVSSSFLSAANPAASISANSPAAAATTKYVNISSGTLNIRLSPSTGASIVAALSKGTSVTVYSEANGWSKVKVNGKDGYVSSSFLSSVNPKSTGNSSTTTQTTSVPATSVPTTKYVNVTSGTLNMRNSPSSGASIMVKLAKGTSVQVYSEANGWSKIIAYGRTGYVSSEFLSDSVQNSVTSTTTVQQTQTVTKYVIVGNGSSLNLRASNSTGSKVLAKLANGTEVQVLSTSNGWSNIKANDQRGFVSSEYLSDTKPNVSNQADTQAVTKYVNVSLGSSLNMRKSPSVNSSIIVKIARGVEVTVLSESNGWANIEAYGQTGYVSREFLSPPALAAGTETSSSGGVTTPNPPESGDVTTGDSASPSSGEDMIKYVNVIYGSSLNMRSSASTDSSVLTKLVRGTAVTVILEENGWSKVTANGTEGYVSSQYLSAKEPVDPNQTSSSSVIAYENYGISLSDFVKLQMEADPQTDKNYNTYIRSDALTLTSSTNGTVKGSGWNVRGGAGTSFWAVGQVSNGASLQILSKVMGNDGFNWYQVTYNKTWVNASPDDVTYYMDPNNFANNTVDSYQFLKLSVTANLDSTEVNNRILSGKGILQGKAAAFITAGTTYGVNEIYLISHALLETGSGKSQLANGVVINGKTVYNMYGIGAYDSDPVNSGAQYAYNAGWFTPEDAIIGGAQFIAKGYINAGQDTLYKMRWNPNSAVSNGFASHQYATDIGWASKQVTQIYNLYQLIDSYKLALDIPKYQ